mgnify:CR=1 FL=1
MNIAICDDEQIYADDITMNKRMGEYGAAVLPAVCGGFCRRQRRSEI